MVTNAQGDTPVTEFVRVPLVGLDNYISRFRGNLGGIVGIDTFAPDSRRGMFCHRRIFRTVVRMESMLCIEACDLTLAAGDFTNSAAALR